MSDGELRKVFRKHLTGFHWQAVETASTGDGVPDLNGCHHDGIEVWLEMKACAHWRISIRPAQIGWCERRLRYNPHVFCAVRRDRTELWLFHASAMRTLLIQRLDMVTPLGQWDGNPSRWDWDEIRTLLTK